MFQAFDEETKQLEWYIKVVTKGNKLRNVWLRQDALDSVARLNVGLIDPEKEGYIFTRTFNKKVDRITADGARKAIKQIADRAGIKETFTPHWFRHYVESQVM